MNKLDREKSKTATIENSYRSDNKCRLRLRFKGEGIVSINDVNYTSDIILNFTANSYVNLLAYNSENSSHRSFFEYWKINDKKVEENPLTLYCEDTFEVISVFRVNTKEEEIYGKPLISLLDFENIALMIENEDDYVYLEDGYLKFKRGCVFIPLKEPLPLFNNNSSCWIKLSRVKARVFSTARGEEGVMEDFMLFLVLDKRVILENILEGPIVAIGYWYSGIGGKCYVVKRFFFYDGQGKPRLEYLAILRENKLRDNVAVDVSDILSRNFLPLELFRDRYVVGIYIFGYDEGFVDFRDSILECGGG